MYRVLVVIRRRELDKKLGDILTKSFNVTIITSWAGYDKIYYIFARYYAEILVCKDALLNEKLI